MGGKKKTCIFAAKSKKYNKTTEYAARMVAMKNAKDNCGDLLINLNLLYNKTRQYRITSEISEIVWASTAIEQGN